MEYEIDEENMRVRQLWQSEQAGPDSVISIAMGDVDWLAETENILVAYGAILDRETLDQVDWRADSRLLFNQWTRLREYVRSDPPEVVYEVVLDTGNQERTWAGRCSGPSASTAWVPERQVLPNCCRQNSKIQALRAQLDGTDVRRPAGPTRVRYLVA